MLGTVPAFALSANTGRTVRADDLRGHVWVADFIFTRCPNVCPRLTEQMARLQRATAQRPGDPLRLVSFSVDPEHDTPEVLTAYAERFHADASRWLFLTGPRAALYGLVRDGFLLPVGEGTGSTEGPIVHSERFVLVDQMLQIRGYYTATDDEAMERLRTDIDRLQKPS